MEHGFDQVMQDVRSCRRRLMGRVGDLRRYLKAHECAENGGGRSRVELFAEKLWTRMLLERGGRCQMECSRCEGELGLQLRSIEVQALLAQDSEASGFELEAVEITVHVVRCFNAAMRLTECRLCAAALVWELALAEEPAPVREDAQGAGGCDAGFL